MSLGAGRGDAILGMPLPASVAAIWRLFLTNCELNNGEALIVRFSCMSHLRSELHLLDVALGPASAKSARFPGVPLSLSGEPYRRDKSCTLNGTAGGVL